ncbi:ABC transporter substrate-binding protein [Tistrella sp. BH-R2-4]|uniref:ABC transporter substrate-binding protein n=1 Tax=Tistrella arctica TaxID=3133430 RepID=A0ABU9YP41_9PROT
MRILKTAAIAAMTAWLAAGTAVAEPKPGGELVIASSQVPRHFNGAVQSGIATAVASTQIFASPLRFDDQWNPQPYLARSWEVAPDGLSVTLHLVENAVFHDGQPVTSEDVAFSIGVIKANHPFQTMLAPVDTVETPDAHTVVIRLSKPHPALLLAMSPPLMPILPKHIYGDGQDVKSHPANLAPIGSGPFKLTEYKQGEYFVLEKFDKYFMPGRPYLDRIVTRIVPDENNRLIMLERGETGMLSYVSGVREIMRMKKMDNVEVTAKGYDAIGPINWLAFNTGKPPLDNVKVRKAIAHAIDRGFILDKLMGGTATPALTPIMPGTPFYTDDVEKYPYDPAAAEALLDEAGFPKKDDGSRFTLTIDYIPNSNDQQRNLAEYIRPQLAKVGITVVVRAAPDFPTWAQRVGSHDFDLTMDQVFNWADPVIGVDRTYLSSNIRKGIIWSNTQQYKNARVDEILAEAASEMDVEKRKALYTEFQKIVVDEVPILYVNAIPYHSAFDKRLRNTPTTIWGPSSPMDEMYWDK